jgi:hypothetical protein
VHKGLEREKRKIGFQNLGHLAIAKRTETIVYVVSQVVETITEAV